MQQQSRNVTTPQTTVPQAQVSTQWEDLDALLDEIDGVLEQNAEAFVANYVQKGGE